MRRRSLLVIVVVAVLAVTGMTVGLRQRAQGESRLATITPAQLLANVAQHAGDGTPLSGHLNWENDVLGMSMLSLAGQGRGDLSAFLSNGSGRLWVDDGRFRFDIRGIAGDTTIVGDTTTVWVYTYASNTATQYALRGGSDATGPDTAPPSAQTGTTNPLAAIDSFIQKLAPDATLAVAGQVSVAGQDCYVLSLLPKAANTVLGSIQVAVDGSTYLPLKLDVYAKGATKPVLAVSFTSVSYSEPMTEVGNDSSSSPM